MATPTIGTVEVFDIRGTLPPISQKSLAATYHPDGVELDVTSVRGGPFSIVVRILDTLSTAESKKASLAALVGQDSVDIVIGDGTIFDKCFIGQEGPGTGVLEANRETVRNQNTEKVWMTLTVTGHRVP